MTEAAVTTKERIIDAAINSFSAKGYSETSMKDIAGLVGIKPASIYNHFKAKEEILDTILNEYISNSNQNVLQLEEIDELIGIEDAKTILNRLFFSFTPDKADRYTKILKIITHEQFREPKATVFIRDHLLKDCQKYIQEVIDRLVAAGEIPPVQSGIYAKILVSLTLSSSVEMMFYGLETYQQMDRVTRGETISFLIEQIVSGR